MDQIKIMVFQQVKNMNIKMKKTGANKNLRELKIKLLKNQII